MIVEGNEFRNVTCMKTMTVANSVIMGMSPSRWSAGSVVLQQEQSSSGYEDSYLPGEYALHFTHDNRLVKSFCLVS